MNHDLLGGPDANWAYAYTPAGQLASRTVVSAYEWGVASLSDGYQRNGLNQYTSVDGAAYSYDPRGNLASDGSRTLTYDLENRLTAVSGSATATLSYDPLGRLRSYTVNSTTTEFLYDGDRLIAEYVGGVLQRRYVHGAGIDEPLTEYRRQTDGGTTRHALIADRQGSIVASIDSTGAAAIHRYGPYGEPDTWSGSRFSYTGQIALPELQLYHYKARVYSPALGRFLQTDPIGYRDDMNLYAYVGNSSLNAIDPTGMEVRTSGDCSRSCRVFDQTVERGTVDSRVRNITVTREIGTYTANSGPELDPQASGAAETGDWARGTMHYVGGGGREGSEDINTSRMHSYVARRLGQSVLNGTIRDVLTSLEGQDVGFMSRSLQMSGNTGDWTAGAVRFNGGITVSVEPYSFRAFGALTARSELYDFNSNDQRPNNDMVVGTGVALDALGGRPFLQNYYGTIHYEFRGFRHR